VKHAAIAIANPVEGDEVSMTNHCWRFSIAALKAALGLDTLLVVNDFAALAMSLPHLKAEQRERIGGGVAQAASRSA
jgi:glucokinase